MHCEYERCGNGCLACSENGSYWAGRDARGSEVACRSDASLPFPSHAQVSPCFRCLLVGLCCAGDGAWDFAVELPVGAGWEGRGGGDAGGDEALDRVFEDGNGFVLFEPAAWGTDFVGDAVQSLGDDGSFAFVAAVGVQGAGDASGLRPVGRGADQ